MQHSVGMRDLIDLLAPGASIVSASNPEPPLREFNVVGVFDSQEAAREAVLALESMEPDDAAIGLTALGHEERRTGIQPEDTTISGDVLGRTGKGALIGAVLGVLIIGGAAALFSTTGVVFGAAAGGALFGAFIGGVWGAFVKMGGSDAYRQSFIENPHGVTLVSLHTDDADESRQAKDRLGLKSLSTPMVIHSDGERLTAD